MICRNCGRENSEKSGYCSFCGYNFANYDVSLPKTDDDDSEVKQKLIISVLLFVLIIILSLILFVVIRLGDNKRDDSETYYTDETEEEEVKSGGIFDDFFGGDRGSDDSANGEKETKDAPQEIESVNTIPPAEYCAAYKKYINESQMPITNAGFIDVNGDDVYELVLVGDCEASGNIILTYGESGIDALQTNRLYFNYIPGENLLCNSDGNSGYYYDLVYSIENGKWTSVASGTYSEKYGENGIELDSYGNAIMEYTWNDQNVDAKTYSDRFGSIYNQEKAVVAIYTNDEAGILNKLSLNTVELCDNYLVHFKEDKAIHTYDVIVSDVSWYEAYRACNERRGHLVHINSKEEFDYIIELLYSKGLQDKKIWLGGRRSYNDEKYHWAAPYYDDDRYYDDSVASIEDDPVYRDFWLQGEPSYYSDDGQGNYFDERYMQMFYSSKQDRFVWNDTVDDVLSVIPSYRGQIAYICEYE